MTQRLLRTWPTPQLHSHSMPVLRRPHDHHRDLRARLSTPAPQPANTDQDRHVMSSSARRSRNAAQLCLLVLARPRHRSRHHPRIARQPTPAPHRASHVLPTPLPTPVLHPCRARPASLDQAATFPRATLPLCSNRHSDTLHRRPHLPRFRALALLGRLPSQRVDGSSARRPRNLHNCRPMAKGKRRKCTVNLSLTRGRRWSVEQLLSASVDGGSLLAAKRELATAADILLGCGGV